MTQNKPSAHPDPMGQAIADYHHTGRAARLWVCSPDFDDDEMPVATLFRTETEMPQLERTALALCHGHVLDVGGGAGCHSLALQERGLKVTTIDISALSVEVMRERGVKNALCVDLYSAALMGQYDTITLLMNGSGIIGRLDAMASFFARMKQLLAPGGCILMDSTDIRYIFEDEDGALDIDLNAAYYGELEYSMRYKNLKGNPFPWLYIDFDTLAYHASQNGFQAEMIEQGEHYDYLAGLRVE